MHLHEAERLLRLQGWVLERCSGGSHRVYKNGQNQTLVLTPHGQRLPFQVGQLRQDLRRLARTDTPTNGERRQADG
jgi:predicted RNA binding protein YcfA (HicA-like mRNA interferase family)